MRPWQQVAKRPLSVRHCDRVALSRRPMSGDRGENAMCSQAPT